MASDDHHTNDSSASPTSHYVKLKQHVIDIKNTPEKEADWNISEVPCILRNLKEKDYMYTPQLISIGPIQGLKNPNSMQDHKESYLVHFWSRTNEKTPEDMDNFKKFLEKEENNIRKCYAQNLCARDKINSEGLVFMMLLDSSFIMELFLRTIHMRKSTAAEEDDVEKNSKMNVEKNIYRNDIIVKQLWLNKGIQRDLLLLENQIPFYILDELYKVYVLPSYRKTHPTFIELASEYFACYYTHKKCDEVNKCSSGFSQSIKNCGTCGKGDSFSGENTGSSYSFNGKLPKHFTDLIRSFFICKGLSPCKKDSPLRTATKLRESGVSFEKVENKPLLDIKFQKLPILSWFLCFGCFPKSSYFKAHLQIPQLKVDDTTECVLRNLIAFEQCHYPDQPYICNYVSFIDSLITTKDDVELLVEKEVIVHELGSDKEVATLVNGLCKYVVADTTCYADIINSLNKHYQRQWNRSMAALRLVYFGDAWRASSTLVATAVLVFTIFNFCRVVRLVLDLEGVRTQP